jgi:hypothetical protein
MPFKVMLGINYVPNAFGTGLTIPIPTIDSNVKLLTS